MVCIHDGVKTSSGLLVMQIRYRSAFSLGTVIAVLVCEKVAL